MYYLIYTSRSTKDWDDSELLELLKKAVLNNGTKGITGLLIFIKDRFVQILEGEHSAVRELYQHIETDPRHDRVNILLSGTHHNKKRLFKDWNMAFKRISYGEFSDITGYKDIEELFQNKPVDDKSHPALVFMKHFSTQALKDFREELSV